MLFLFLLGGSALFPVMGAFAQNLQQNEQEESVSGTVVNAVTNAPVARALVHSLDDRFAMLTDSAGHFEFKLPKPDASGTAAGGGSTAFSTEGAPRLVRGNAGTPLWVEARKPGFLGSADGRTPIVPSADAEITIALVPEALIQGRITLSTGEPALGVSVELLSRQVREGLPRWIPRGMERADSNGEFRFAELPAGSYKLLTREMLDNDPATTIPGGQMFGFAPVFYPGVADFGAAGSIELTPGQTFQADISLTHQPYYPVKIPLAEGEVEGGINVNVSLQGKRGPGYSLGYNNGAHQIEGSLPNGNYVVEASAYGPTNAGTGTVNLRVAGAAADGPTMTLTRDSSISLEVKEEFSDRKWGGTGSWSDGKRNVTFHGPRSYLFVGVEPADDFETSRGASLHPPAGPNDESMVFENLAPGRYWLRLNSQRGYVAEATAGGVDLLHEPLTVGGGGNIPIEIRMRDDFAELEGTVTGLATRKEGTEEVPGWLYCVPLAESPGQFQQVGISSDGTFGTLTVAPGNYLVLAFSKPQPELPYRDAEAMKAYDGKGTVVHVAGGQKASVQVPVIGGQ